MGYASLACAYVYLVADQVLSRERIFSSMSKDYLDNLSILDLDVLYCYSVLMEVDQNNVAMISLSELLSRKTSFRVGLMCQRRARGALGAGGPTRQNGGTHPRADGGRSSSQDLHSISMFLSSGY